MYLKAYQKGLWLFPGYPVLFSGVFLTMYMPVALLLSFLPGHTFFSLGGGATLLFYVGELLTISLYPILGSMKSFHKFVLLWPFLRLTHGVSYVLTIITNTITWAGIKYRLDGKGDVTSIQRPEGSVL
jgi:hypothetical protein